ADGGEQVKVAVLAGSVTAALLATVVLRLRNRAYRRIHEIETLDLDRDGVPDVYEADWSGRPGRCSRRRGQSSSTWSRYGSSRSSETSSSVTIRSMLSQGRQRAAAPVPSFCESTAMTTWSDSSAMSFLISHSSALNSLVPKCGSTAAADRKARAKENCFSAREATGPMRLPALGSFWPPVRYAWTRESRVRVRKVSMPSVTTDRFSEWGMDPARTYRVEEASMQIPTPPEGTRSASFRAISSFARPARFRRASKGCAELIAPPRTRRTRPSSSSACRSRRIVMVLTLKRAARSSMRRLPLDESNSASA